MVSEHIRAPCGLRGTRWRPAQIHDDCAADIADAHRLKRVTVDGGCVAIAGELHPTVPPTAHVPQGVDGRRSLEPIHITHRTCLALTERCVVVFVDKLPFSLVGLVISYVNKNFVHASSSNRHITPPPCRLPPPVPPVTSADPLGTVESETLTSVQFR